MTFRLSEFDPHWLRKPSQSRTTALFRRAATAAVVAKCFENVGDPVAFEIYRNEAVYFTAKGLEALALETTEGGI